MVEQLSNSIGWRIILVQSSTKKVAQATVRGAWANKVSIRKVVHKKSVFLQSKTKAKFLHMKFSAHSIQFLPCTNNMHAWTTFRNGAT